MALYDTDDEQEKVVLVGVELNRLREVVRGVSRAC